jgi:hypothetical protein
LQAGEEGIELGEGFAVGGFEGFDRGYALGELLLEGKGGYWDFKTTQPAHANTKARLTHN